MQRTDSISLLQLGVLITVDDDWACKLFPAMHLTCQALASEHTVIFYGLVDVQTVKCSNISMSNVAEYMMTWLSHKCLHQLSFMQHMQS